MRQGCYIKIVEIGLKEILKALRSSGREEVYDGMFLAGNEGGMGFIGPGGGKRGRIAIGSDKSRSVIWKEDEFLLRFEKFFNLHVHNFDMNYMI
ncbi:hypothetical protein NPIL_317101 [Nephila pilipes]|uniref:Uncharacterized protein n=1 Tax=Nephila pilipes TaxID=299642 RepID=A0A8X6ME37_NEPPI|nr:hypothetical protein NPIL_317101 [Nephila pilipes]